MLRDPFNPTSANSSHYSSPFNFKKRGLPMESPTSPRQVKHQTTTSPVEEFLMNQLYDHLQKGLLSPHTVQKTVSTYLADQAPASKFSFSSAYSDTFPIPSESPKIPPTHPNIHADETNISDDEYFQDEKMHDASPPTYEPRTIDPALLTVRKSSTPMVPLDDVDMLDADQSGASAALGPTTTPAPSPPLVEDQSPKSSEIDDLPSDTEDVPVPNSQESLSNDQTNREKQRAEFSDDASGKDSTVGDDNEQRTVSVNSESINKGDEARIEPRADLLSPPEASATSASNPLPSIKESGASDLLQTFLNMDERDPEVEELAAASSVNRRLLDINAIPAEKLAPDPPSRPPISSNSPSETTQEPSNPSESSPSSSKIPVSGRSAIPPPSPTIMPLTDANEAEQDPDLVEVDEAGKPVDSKKRELLYIPTSD
jgi:hypothetical protein